MNLTRDERVRILRSLAAEAVRELSPYRGLWSYSRPGQPRYLSVPRQGDYRDAFAMYCMGLAHRYYPDRSAARRHFGRAFAGCTPQEIREVGGVPV
jgi:hypothetical protein